MGKRIVLFTTVLGACAAGQVMGMEESSNIKFLKMLNEHSSPSLNFYLSNGLKIKGYSADRMEFFKKPAKFKGQEILETLPLDKTDKLKLAAAFALARRTDKKVTETYTLEQVKFLATITPLIKSKKSKKHNFFVEVQPVAQTAQEAEQTITHSNNNSTNVFEAMLEL